jgi:hypothetical protein
MEDSLVRLLHEPMSKAMASINACVSHVKPIERSETCEGGQQNPILRRQSQNRGPVIHVNSNDIIMPLIYEYLVESK